MKKILTAFVFMFVFIVAASLTSSAEEMTSGTLSDTKTVSPRPSASAHPLLTRVPASSVTKGVLGSPSPGMMTNEAEMMRLKKREAQMKILRQDLEKKVRDDKRKEAVQRVDKRIDDLNTKWARYFNDTLTKLEKMLSRVKER